MPMPDYPSPARYGNVQGTVNVKVSIGPDGNVIFASGSGAPEILIQAATENAKNWRFGPFPTVSEFPIEHTIQFTYVLEGKATVVAPRPTVRTFLPDRIEVQAVPLVSDYSPIEDYKPLPQPKDLGKQLVRSRSVAFGKIAFEYERPRYRANSEHRGQSGPGTFGERWR